VRAPGVGEAITHVPATTGKPSGSGRPVQPRDSAAGRPPFPSFLIAGAPDRPPAGLRLDRINSQQVFQQARQALFRYMEGCPGGGEPIGVVLQGQRGRVVFEQPILLPDEQFVPIDLLRARPGNRAAARLRMPRSR